MKHAQSHARIFVLAKELALKSIKKEKSKTFKCFDFKYENT